MANTPARAPTLPMVQTDNDWGQLARQSVARSHAYGLLKNGAPTDEVSEALPTIAADLDAALAGFALETRTLVDADDATAERVLKDDIGGFVRLTGGSWLPEHRREYMEQCLVEFASIPLHLLLPALAQARRTVFDPKRLVSWVFEYVDRDVTRLQAEGDILSRLAEIRG